MSLPEIEVFIDIPTIEQLKEDVLIYLIDNVDTFVDLEEGKTVYTQVKALFESEV